MNSLINDNLSLIESYAKGMIEPQETKEKERYHEVKESDEKGEDSFLLAGHEYVNSLGAFHHIRAFLATSPNPVDLSTQLIQEITKWSKGHSLSAIINDLQTLQSAISSITDKATLTTLESNIGNFDQIRAQKSEANAQWNEIEDLVMQIETGIYTQELQLPDVDKDALLQKMASLMENILKKLDQFSPEQLTSLINQVANLQKQIDSLPQNLQGRVDAQISQLKAQIDQEVTNQIQEIKNTELKNLIIDFETALQDYLNGDNNINTLLGKQYEVSQQKGEAFLSMIVTKYFAINDFPKWANFANGIENGDGDIIPSNPAQALSLRATCLNIIKQQSLLTQVDGYVTYEHVFLSQTASIDTYLDPTNAKQVFSDLAATVTSVLQLNAIKNLIGSKIFSYDNFQSAFGFDTVIPLLPSGLNVDLLTQPCPFDPSQKIWQTHFLFYIPQAIRGQPNVSWQSFVSNLNTGDYSFYIQEAFFWWRDSVNTNPYDGGKWVLLYQINQANMPSEYDFASIIDIIPGLSCWRKSGNNPPFLYGLYPYADQGGAYYIKDYPIGMFVEGNGIQFEGESDNSNASKILLRNLY